MNQRLPSLNAKDVLRALQKAGFVVSRTSATSG
jgi:predicted RNA binding protein YcfA (HicA-like mRNA interferase family)